MLADQIATVIRTRLLDPVEILFGDAGDLPARTEVLARQLAATIEGDDERAAVHALSRLIGALYPGDGPFDPPAGWWRTPLGRAVARRIGHPGARTVPYSVAGAMLGVTKQGVHDLVRRGKLIKGTEGGVTTDSVRERLNS
ncbi:hypothetical protein FNH05_08780 [Amycolatopsis rhizosphaerae]|uniref:Uncharacterized protein n=1 Tax=Amycolatopsis rhizosphaerae TaxID=2053003 RepID=A0A558D4Y4_9PSEU|nr:hypothetical protein [Amycolatopsis rhizosphaerae]TVT56084.1 hypothetical protein FNH05_08780 [Amycolatopsis rhizosphaerae]